VRIAVSGDLGGAVQERLERTIAAFLGSGVKHVVLDVHETGLINADGVALISRLQRAAEVGACRLDVIGVPPDVELPAAHPPATAEPRRAPRLDAATARCVLVVDLVDSPGRQLAAGLRDAQVQLGREGKCLLLVDLGSRTRLTSHTIHELLRTHFAVAEGGGRCVFVASPAVAAQVSRMHPVGTAWAARREVAVTVLLGWQNRLPSGEAVGASGR
jgi:hypothetical protein